MGETVTLDTDRIETVEYHYDPDEQLVTIMKDGEAWLTVDEYLIDAMYGIAESADSEYATIFVKDITQDEFEYFRDEVGIVEDVTLVVSEDDLGRVLFEPTGMGQITGAIQDAVSSFDRTIGITAESLQEAIFAIEHLSE